MKATKTKTTTNGAADKGESAPAPSSEKHATLRTLKPAVLDYCRAYYRWRWGWIEDEGGRRVRPMLGAHVEQEIAELNYRPEIAHWEAAQPWEREAAPILERLEQAMKEGLRFEKRLRSRLGEDAPIGVVAASLLAKARAALKAFGAGEVLETERRPSRRTWLRDFAIIERYLPIDRRELAVLSLLAGWWPEAAEPTENARRTSEHRGAMTVKGVIGLETKYLESAEREPGLDAATAARLADLIRQTGA